MLFFFEQYAMQIIANINFRVAFFILIFVFILFARYDSQDTRYESKIENNHVIWYNFL